MHYLSFNFAVRPLNFLPVHEYAFLSRIRPQNVFTPCNVAPGGRWPARLRPNSGQPAVGVGQAQAGGGLWVSLARFSGLVGGEGAGGWAHRRPGGSGRHDCQSRRGAAPWGKWVHRRALVVGIEGGKAP
jgi:hypothetical protein